MAQCLMPLIDLDREKAYRKKPLIVDGYRRRSRQWKERNKAHVQAYQKEYNKVYWAKNKARLFPKQLKAAKLRRKQAAKAKEVLRAAERAEVAAAIRRSYLDQGRATSGS